MTTLLLFLWVLVAATFIAAMSVHPERSRRSWFELKRQGDEVAMLRERHFEAVDRIRTELALVKITILTLLGLLLWQGWGVIAVIGLIIASGPIAKLSIVRSASLKAYVHIERLMLDAVEKSSMLHWLVSVRRVSPKSERLESEEQLRHLVETSGNMLGDDQKAIVLNGLQWHQTSVASVMTKRSGIVTIKHSELLGPLVLDDLHKTGHSRFPVIKGDLDTVVGILDISELLEIDAGKKSTTAEKSMQPRALRIEADEPLPAALAMLQKSRQHLLIVINGEGKTVGLLTLSDITGSLLGK